LVSACLTKEPADRPTSGEVLDALAELPEELPENGPVEKRPPVPVPPGTATQPPGTADVTGESGATGKSGDAEKSEQDGRSGPRRGRKALWTALAAVVVLGIAGTASVVQLADSPATVVGEADQDGSRTAPRGAVPPGWKPWHNALKPDEDEPFAMGPTCTANALGVFCSSPTIALMRLNPANGQVDWTKPMSAKKVSGFSLREPVVHDGVVYVNSADRSEGVDAFDGRTGKRLWHLDGPLGEFAYMGGVLVVRLDQLGPRLGAIVRSRLPYVGSVGALDMVNFGAPDTIPERYRGRKFHVHNPQVTLMRTTAEENERMGRWIADRLNQMDGPVRFFLPEGGVSALDARGQPFWDPEADAALFRALEHNVRQTGNRQLIRVPKNINDPDFAAAIVGAFRTLFGRTGARRRLAR
jgi:hypothetical protein